MGKLTLTDLHKRYEGHTALHRLSLTIEAGEFVTLLGPSGCGKTTTLRMIAGFIMPTAGTIALNGRVIAGDGVHVPPERRNMGMVFQSYAVWPHMRVFDNVAYPLRLRKLAHHALKDKVATALELVRLSEYAARYPHELSGGQQQRVALARTLAMQPDVLLLDEPLSNLDAKLRETMRYEIVELQKRLNMTVVYVTHDQLEALAMSDRIVVMSQGEVQQVGAPQAIYTQPANRFVAGFIGTANFIPCTVVNPGRVAITAWGQRYEVLVRADQPIHSPQPVLFARPNEIHLHDASQPGIPGRIVSQTFLGDHYESIVSLGEVQVRIHNPNPPDVAIGEAVSLTFARATVLA